MPEKQEQSNKLTPKQQAFVDAYVGVAKGNATQAARLAGYTGEDNTLGQTGHQNLKNPKIQQAISDRASEYAMSPAEVLAELADIARNSSVTPFIDPATYGKPALILSTEEGTLKPETRFLKSVTVTDDSVKVDVYDRVAALVQIGKYHGLWVERTELTGRDGEPLNINLVEVVRPTE